MPPPASVSSGSPSLQASLAGLPALLRGDSALAALLGSGDAVVAMPEPARAFVLAAIAELGSSPLLLVATPTASEAEHLAHDLGAFTGSVAVDLLPAWETLPFERVSPSVETMGRRLQTMWHLRHGTPAAGADGGTRRRILVAPVKALLQRLGPAVADAEPVVVRLGDTLDPAELVERLVRSGYRREYQVEHRGEVAVRGGIVDVFPSTGDAGIRIDLFGDEVDRLTEFDVSDQRSTVSLDAATIFGCRELILTPELRERARSLVRQAPFAREQFERIAEGLVFDGMESWLPWLAPDEQLITDLVDAEARVALVDPRRIRDRAAELAEEEASLAHALATTWGADEDAGLPRLHLPYERMLARTAARVVSAPAAAENPDTPSILASGWPPVVGDPTALIRRIGELVADGYSVVVCAEGEGSAARLAAVLSEEGLVIHGGGARSAGPARDGRGPSGPARAGRAPGGEPDLRRPGVHVVVRGLDRGFVLPAAKVAVLAESDLTGRRRAHRQARARPRPVEGFFDDLQQGDYVVHHVHGVARYGGMVTRAIGGGERDYLLLEYRGDDRLYVPSDQIDAVTPYSGGESPALSRLGGAEWTRQKARVRAAVREVAQELVVLYRRRVTEPGHAFPPDTPWQAELEQAFPYVETPDQLRAIEDVKADMERDVPMDRLVCGDVGFGKTEVAIRAVFKAVQDGRQAAILVPTTLLAQQHFQTFSDRYAPYPVRVEMLSRFLTPAEARRVVEGIADGSVDVAIGTHRLLGGDVKFKDLGLLVVDEEQRFGVTHKESIKQVRVGVDVLTLTASPIPRTLEMSLTGIRDLSLITTPPADRQPILTYVGEYDELAVSEAIRRELLREGQVFFVHNRVRDIERVAARVRQLVPGARVVVAHGQMDEALLEQVVLDFWDGQHDVLVCTTIIESGIDMPTVNTLVVDRADMLGLGQLHQLRGRVGRAGQRAYAYLLYPPDRVVTEQAYERLRTIGENTELGSGFKIAMRDLEIRGAGNLLGADQSGHIAAVGYDLYVRMVAEAVAELKGETPAEPAEIKLDLSADAYLPTDYVEREDLRLEAYRRLATVTSHAEVEDIRAEWVDRYGPPPAPAEALLSVAGLRAECARTGVREVTVVSARPGGRQSESTARLSPLHLRASARVRLSRKWPRAIFKEDLGQLVLPFPARVAPAVALAEVLRELVPEEPVPEEPVPAWP
jgi:transcription-repair coupling factor (superfamily II helicase)